MVTGIPAPEVVLLFVFASWALGVALGGVTVALFGSVAPGHFKVVWLTVAALGAVSAILNPVAWMVTIAGVLAYVMASKWLPLVWGTICLMAALVAPLLVLTEGPLNPALSFLACTAILGSTTSAMLLGHWRLNQPRMDLLPLRVLGRAVWGSLAVFVAISIYLGSVPAICAAAVVAVLAAMVSHLIKLKSIMSATGILYLEILIAFVAAFSLAFRSL